MMDPSGQKLWRDWSCIQVCDVTIVIALAQGSLCKITACYTLVG